MRTIVIIIAALAASACGQEQPTPEPQDSGLSSVQPPIPVPEDVREVLRSADCVDVAQFYFEALSSGEYADAALVWDDPVVDDERLRALFANYDEPEFAWEEPVAKSERGLPVCTVRASLTDAADDSIAPIPGTVSFERVPETANPDGGPSRWQVMEQDFIEPLARSGTGAG